MPWQELARELSAAKHGETTAIIVRYSALTGLGRDALYRKAATMGYVPNRKKRVDKGILKSEITEQQLHFVSSLMQTTARQVKGVIMTVKKALEIAVDNNVIEKDQISDSRLQALLRERSMNKAALDSDTASIRMRALHPNHVHTFDASPCIQYYLKKGGLAIVDERDFNNKKPANMAKIKNRLIRMVLVDHCSGTIFVKYYLALGENSRITQDFLTSAWKGIGHEKLPFRGVPFFLLMDAGSANIAKTIMAFINALGIQTPKSLPHNARRQGSAEVVQNIVERQFECTLGLEPAYTMEELNTWATDWMIGYNGTAIHSRHGMTRTQCWLKIKQEQLQELPSPEMLQLIVREPFFTRIIEQDNTIKVENIAYRLSHIPNIRPRQKVVVHRRPFIKNQLCVVFEDAEYMVDPILTDEYGYQETAAIIGEEFKGQPETPAEVARKTNSDQAYGGEKKKGQIPYDSTLVVHGNQAEKVRAIPIPKRSTPMDLSRDIVAQCIPIMQHIRNLKNATEAAIKPELNKEFKSLYGKTINVKESERIIAAIVNQEEWRNEETAADHAQVM